MSPMVTRSMSQNRIAVTATQREPEQRNVRVSNRRRPRPRPRPRKKKETPPPVLRPYYEEDDVPVETISPSRNSGGGSGSGRKTKSTKRQPRRRRPVSSDSSISDSPVEDNNEVDNFDESDSSECCWSPKSPRITDWRQRRHPSGKQISVRRGRSRERRQRPQKNAAKVIQIELVDRTTKRRGRSSSGMKLRMAESPLGKNEGSRSNRTRKKTPKSSSRGRTPKKRPASTTLPAALFNIGRTTSSTSISSTSSRSNGERSPPPPKRAKPILKKRPSETVTSNNTDDGVAAPTAATAPTIDNEPHNNHDDIDETDSVSVHEELQNNSGATTVTAAESITLHYPDNSDQVYVYCPIRSRRNSSAGGGSTNTNIGGTSNRSKSLTRLPSTTTNATTGTQTPNSASANTSRSQSPVLMTRSKSSPELSKVKPDTAATLDWYFSYIRKMTDLSRLLAEHIPIKQLDEWIESMLKLVQSYVNEKLGFATCSPTTCSPPPTDVDVIDLTTTTEPTTTGPTTTTTTGPTTTTTTGPTTSTPRINNVQGNYLQHFDTMSTRPRGRYINMLLGSFLDDNTDLLIEVHK